MVPPMILQSKLMYLFLEVTLGITALEYCQRRSNLAAKLPRNAIAIIAASDVKYRSGAVFYEFHQNSNFFYLTGRPDFCNWKPILTDTGFNEPEAVAVISIPMLDSPHKSLGLTETRQKFG